MFKLQVHRAVAFLSAFALMLGSILAINTVSAQEAPAMMTLESSFTIFAEGLKKQDLFDLVSNPMNDELWYPGVMNTELISEGTHPTKPIGNKYLQTLDYGLGFPVYLEVEVLEYVPNEKVVLKGIGLQSFTATYSFANVPGGATWTLASTLVAPFIDLTALTQGLYYAHYGIANVLGATSFTSTVDYAYFL